ncbi:MAG: 23S rRNA (guanosine(2251)-2'-O)-methyltransferase RlmB [Bryobacteraceae bacterium]
MILIGIHPVLEALRTGAPLERILVAKGAGGPKLQEAIELARRQSIPLRFEARDVLDRVAGRAAHQGVVALGASHRYAELDGVIRDAGLLVVLDGVEDPHNLGAIIRTAHAAGAAAVVIPERRAAGLTETVAKAAAGALQHLPIVRAGNVNRVLDRLKEKGYWIYGFDERGENTYDSVTYSHPAALVFGGEGKGLHELVRKKCDALVRIPMPGKIPSLNVSVAAGIVLFEWRRRSHRS